jgi:Tfp pilus assembly protein PilF
MKKIPSPLQLALLILPLSITLYLGFCMYFDTQKDYLRLLALMPWRLELYEKAAFSETDPAQARLLLETARRQGALTPAGRLALAENYFQSGDTAQALAEWRGLLESGQETAIAGDRLAAYYHQQRDYAAEAHILRRWLSFDAKNAAANERLGLLLAASSPREALPFLRAAGTNSPETALRLRGLLSSLEAALLQPSASYQLIVAGRELASRGEWPLAETAFARAVEANPRYAEAWGWLGEARQQAGSQKDALVALQAAVRLDPDSALLRGFLGLYFQRRAEYSRAAEEFARAAALEPQTPYWGLLAGEAAASQGDLLAALGQYQLTAENNPQDPQTWRALALFCLEYETYIEETGLPAAYRAWLLDRADPLNMDAFGRVLTALEQVESAERMFLQAIQADPQFAAAHFHLALLYLETERLDKARYSLAQALRLDPQGEIGAQARRLLERYFP